MRRPVYLIEWDDAHGNSDMFNDTDVDHRPMRFFTVGFLIKSDEVGVSLAMDFSEGRYRDHKFILRANVRDEQPIVKPRKKKVAETRKPAFKPVRGEANPIGEPST